MKLVDGLAMNKEFPDTFHIPSQEEKDAVFVGMFVKLGFIGKKGTERMWVQVISINDGEYEGTIANNPVVVRKKFGDVVDFKQKHILSITT